VSGRHRRRWPENMPLLLVPVVIVGGPIGLACLAAGLYLLARAALRWL